MFCFYITPLIPQISEDNFFPTLTLDKWLITYTAKFLSQCYPIPFSGHCPEVCPHLQQYFFLISKVTARAPGQKNEVDTEEDHMILSPLTSHIYFMEF